MSKNNKNSVSQYDSDIEEFEKEDRRKADRNRKAKQQQEIAAVELASTKSKQILLPNGMSVATAMRVLRDKKIQEDTEVNVREVVDAWPLDGAVAFQHVLEEKYGFVNQVPIPGFFGDTPPMQIGVCVDAQKNTKQVNWGRMTLSVLDHGYLETGYVEENGTLKFVISGSVKKKFMPDVQDIAAKTRQRVKEASIYKGKAIQLNFRDSDGDRKDFSPADSPTFLDIDASSLDEVIYNEDVQGVVEMALFNPIKYPDACREVGVPLKRGALLEGVYGTGKTITARQMAVHGNANGFTFLYSDDARDLDLLMKFAELYTPCICLVEDLDQIARRGMRDKAEVNRLTNILDGVGAKGREIFTVFTTNHKHNIDGVFIRPGRIDCVVTLLPPDEGSAVRLVRKYARNSQGDSILEDGITDEAIASSVRCLVELEANAAFYRETVERAKLAAIPTYAETGDLRLSADNLKASAKSMESHIELMKAQSPGGDGGNTVADDAFASAIAAAMAPPPSVLKKMMQQMRPKSAGF